MLSSKRGLLVATCLTAIALSIPASTIQQAIAVFTSSTNGLVPASGGGTTNFLRADGTFAVPPGGGSGSVTNIATTSPISGGPITTTGTIACAMCTVTVASGTKALATGAISSATCTAAQTATATGTLTTDTIQATFNADPTAVTGYIPSTSGMLTIIPYPTADTVNFKVCNNTSASITPGSITLNFRVTR
jgi:hypothetical protein